MAKKSSKKKAHPGVNKAKSAHQIETIVDQEKTTFHKRLLDQIVGSLWIGSEFMNEQVGDTLKAAIAALQGINPKGEMEGMLAVQMVATHNAAMECLRRAMIRDQTFEGRDQNLKHASKLLSVYARQIETLDKHRGKGQQKVTVEYVNVEAGGQAIVGDVNPDGRSRKRSGLKKESPKYVTHEPGEVIELKADKPVSKAKRKK